METGSDGTELLIHAFDFCNALGDDWDCIIPMYRATNCFPFDSWCENYAKWWQDYPERYTLTSAAYDLKHTMQIMSSYYDETYFYVLSAGKQFLTSRADELGTALANEFFKVNPGRSFAVTSYPGSTCPYDGITLINTETPDSLQKLLIQQPLFGEDFACPIFMLGESDMQDMRDMLTSDEAYPMVGFPNIIPTP